MRLTAFAWRARILSQKAPRNVSRLSPGHAADLSPLRRRRTSFRAQGPGGRQCGKRVQRWKGGFATKKEARRSRSSRMFSLGSAMAVTSSRRSSHSALSSTTSGCRRSRGLFRPLTLTQYRSVMKGRILPRLGHVRLQAVTGGHLNGLYRELEDEGLSPASRRLTHAVLSRTFRDAVRWGRLVRNPAAAADPPAAAESRATARTEEELGRFLEQVKGDRSDQPDPADRSVPASP
jgi:Arm DNA-binding domain